jgi:hypothetical protein
MTIRRLGTALLWATVCIASTVQAQTAVQARETGASAIWLLANFCFAGMRAQDHPSAIWRMTAFVFGLPGTLLTCLLVPEGSERVYGVDLPKRRQ